MTGKYFLQQLAGIRKIPTMSFAGRDDSNSNNYKQQRQNNQTNHQKQSRIMKAEQGSGFGGKAGESLPPHMFLNAQDGRKNSCK